MLRVELERTWTFVQEQYENYDGHEFTSSQKLALCLYHLELKHHFNGDGILVSKTNRNEKIWNRDETKFKNKVMTEDKVVSKSVSLA